MNQELPHSNPPSLMTTMQTHLTNIRTADRSVVCSSPSMLVSDASRPTQTVMEGLTKYLKAPRGAPGLELVCLAAAGGIELVIKLLTRVHPRLRSLHTSISSLMDELDEKHGGCYETTRSNLKGKRTTHPVWTRTAILGELEGTQCRTQLFALGCAVILAFDEQAQVPASLSKTLAKLASVDPVTEEQLHLLLGSDVADGTNMSDAVSALRRLWTKVLKRYGFDQPPPVRTPSERIDAQVLSAALNATARHVAGALTDRLLTEHQFQLVCRLMREEITRDTFKGVLCLLVIRTGLSVDVIPSMPLVNSETQPGQVGIDVARAAVVIPLHVLANEASQPLPGSIPAHHALTIHLPGSVAGQLRARLVLRSAAKSLACLYPDEFVPDPNSSVYVSQEEIAPTWSRLRRTFCYFLRNQGVNKLHAALACGDFGVFPRSKLHYAAVDAEEFHEVEQLVYAKLQLDEPTHILDGKEKGIGSAVVPRMLNVVNHDQVLAALVQERRPGKTASLQTLRQFHNAYTRLAGWRLWLLLALRETQVVELDAALDPEIATWISVHDKCTRQDRGFQPVALCDYAAKTILLYQQHCKAMAIRFTRVSRRATAFSSWCEAVGERQNVRLLSLVNERDEIQGLPSRALITLQLTNESAQMVDGDARYVLAPDVSRKVMENALRHHGARSSDIDNHLRHFTQGQEPASAFDTSVLNSRIRRLAATQQKVATALLGALEVGLSKGLVRREQIARGRA